MWVIGKSYPACNLQKQPEMKHCRKERHLQNYQVSADLFLIVWNDSSWQHKANLTSLERSFKGRRCFLAQGKSWAGNSGYKAHIRVGAILRSSITTTQSFIWCSLFHTKHAKIATGETWKSEIVSLCQRHLRAMMICCYGFKQWFKSP